MKLKKNKITFPLIILLTIFCFAIPVFSAETATMDEQIEQLTSIIDSSSKYSDFRKNQILLPKLKELLEEGISFENTKEIVENSVKKLTDAYDMRDIFDALLETKKKGLFAVSIINKINEGLSKNASKGEIISVISTKAENLKKANEILNEALQEGLEIDGEEEMVGILADSLENDVPGETLSWLVQTGTTEGKSIMEISEISEELSYLSLLATDSGLSSEEVSLLFQKAIENSINIEEICENIQTNLEAQMSTAKTVPGGTVKPSAISDGGTPSSSSTGSSVEVGETPTQEAGEAPTETSSGHETSTPPAEEAPSPPEN